MLPGDVARCNGRRRDMREPLWGGHLYDCCKQCARCLSPAVGDYQVWIAAPAPQFESGKCPLRREKESVK
jgi:hypothetical protein